MNELSLRVRRMKYMKQISYSERQVILVLLDNDTKLRSPRGRLKRSCVQATCTMISR